MEPGDSQVGDIRSSSKWKLLQHFLGTCASHPDSTAIAADAHGLTYKQLHKAAGQVQSILNDVGVKQTQIVAICIPRSSAVVAAVVGCVLHGAVFLLVDPALPAQRMQLQFEISKPRAVLYSVHDHSKIESVLHTCAVPIEGIGVQMEGECITFPRTIKGSQGTVENTSCSNDVFYIIFTSGSTGIPKAVCASASGSLNRFEWMWNEFPFQSNDVVCFKTSVNFVDCIWEVLGAVLKGACLAIPLEEEAKDPRLLVAFMKKWRVTRVTFVPSYLRHFLEFTAAPDSLQSLTHCISSGEPLSLSLARMFLEAAPSCRLLNLYGTSEICGDITYFEVTRLYLEQTSSSFVPIGKPIPNVDIEVTDVATGEAIPQTSSREGELVTFGSCVAHSYLNSSDKSLAHTSDRSIFNTHDLVHYNSSGDLMYIGRRDHQIKVRGVRINPSEIEAVLEKNSIIERAVVATDENHTNLIGFIQISKNHHSSKDVSTAINYGGTQFFTNSSHSEAIAAELLLSLPQYLVPTLYIFTYRLPTLPSGKVSRKELPPLSEIKKLFSESVSECVQLNKTEQQVCYIFKEILNLTNVSLSGNFFALGGNSLLAINLASSIQECFHCEISVATVVSNPTIKSLAQVIDKSASKVEPAPVSAALQQALIDYTGPITYSQECTWCYEAMASCPLYDLGTAGMCLKPIDADVLKTSIHHLAMKNESLRTIYCCSQYGHPFQKVMKYESPEFTSLLASAFVVKDCSVDCPLTFQGTQINLPSFEFDLIHGPLWKFSLFTNVTVPWEKECRSIIAFQAHHMMTDGWSIQLLMAELEDIYTKLSIGELTLPAPNPSTFLFAIRQAIAERAKPTDKELQLWSTKFQSGLLPPFFHPKCLLTCTYTGSSASVIHKNFAVSMADIRSLCQANGMSEFVPVFTGLLTAIFALNGNTDVLASLMVAIRNAENAKIPGFSVDSFPLRITFDGSSTLYSLLSTVKAGVLEVMENQISWYEIEKALMKRGKLMPDLTFSSGVLNQLDIVFDYKNSMPFSNSKLFKNVPVCLSACESLMDFYIDVGTDALDVQLAYSNTLYGADTVQALLDTWERVLETMVKHVYLNVPLKRLCSDIYVSCYDKASKTLEAGSISHNLFQSNSETAVSLNGNDVLSWLQFCSIQKLLVQFLGALDALPVSNRPVVLAHLSFSALSIALIAAITKLEHSFAFCSSLEEIIQKVAEMSRNGFSCLIVVRDAAEKEQIKKYCSINVSIVTIESFHCIPPAPDSNVSAVDFKIANTKWQSDISACSKVLNVHFASTTMNAAVTVTSPHSSTFAIAVNLLLQGIPVRAYTCEHIVSFVEAANEDEVGLILIQETAVPSVLPKIVGCKANHLWIHGLPLGLAYLSSWVAASQQHVQVIVTHSLLDKQHLITHHLNLKDIPSVEDGIIPCIQIGKMCPGLNGKVIHRDGRDVCQGFIGTFATVDGNQVHRSTSLVRELPKDGSFELVSVSAEAYYKGIDVTPALLVLSTIPEVSWCGVSQDKNSAVVYAAQVDFSELGPFHHKITQLLVSTLSIAYAGLIHQLLKPPPITGDHNITCVNQDMCTNFSDVHWLYSDPALSQVKDNTLPDKIVELVSKHFDTDPETARQTCDLLSIGGNSTAIILSLTVGLNATFNASFSIPAVNQAIHDGRLVSLVLNGSGCL